MKIHIFGASGSGVTTLGKALAQKWNYPYFDSDDYFWEKSDPPFTIRCDPELRNELLLHDLSQSEHWILGGSIIQWGESWTQLFDLVVFLLLPPHIRINRLKKREHERYGDIIYTDPERKKQYEDFLRWAGGYDDNTTKSRLGKGSGRTLEAHRNWIKKLDCKFLEISGDMTVEERIEIVTKVI